MNGSQSELRDTSGAARTIQLGPLLFTLLLVAALVAIAYIQQTATEDSPLTLVFLLCEVSLVSVVIWQACEPFADAAQWIGRRFGLPGSVRGATLDAVASSMPELLSGIFFVVIALNAVAGGTKEDVIAAGSEGYGSTIATCVGSAIFNMIVIPALCALVISFTRHERPTIDVEDEVITRDGLWYVACVALLVIFLLQREMSWWMGVAFLVLYTVYVWHLSRDARAHPHKKRMLHQHFERHGTDVETETVVQSLKEEGVSVSHALVASERNEYSESQVEDEVDARGQLDATRIVFGTILVPLNMGSVWLVIAGATAVSAVACYFLVESTLDIADHLQVPTFFVAVILAAAASSVPDTLLAIGAARRGDDSGAVSNAFGSNIFDVCICLSIPLFVNSWLTGGDPVQLTQNGKPLAGLLGLLLLLAVLSVATLSLLWHKRQLTRAKSLLLLLLYGIFLGYAILGSLDLLPF